MSRSSYPPELSPHLIQAEQLTRPIDWVALFGADQPVEIEVGPGKGMFLANAAEANPGHGFLGIERAGKYVRRTADRLLKRRLANAKVLAGDAGLIFDQFIVPATVAKVHVYFPDPWWKKRHLKRRVFNPSFLENVARALQPGGELHVATDVEGYFREITELVAKHPLFLPLSPPTESAGEHDLDYLTNFERKFRREGRPIYRAAYQRISASK